MGANERSMKISVIGYAKFKAVMGDNTPLVVEMEKGTLKDVLETCCRRFGKPFEELVFDSQTHKEKRSNLILVNGLSHLNLRERLQIELKNGDEIALLPTLVGG